MPAGQGAIRVPIQLGVVMGVQINKPWGHDEPVCIQRFRRIARLELPVTVDLRDFSILRDLRHPRSAGCASHQQLFHP